jgi:hydroxymethylglutaryl-CoA lyase
VVSLPRAVSIREVGPRDGFQNEPEVIPTERKVELIDALARTGLRRLEVTSFVRADVIPQLADAPEVLARIDVPPQVSVSVLVPNERGLDGALALRESHLGDRPAFDEISVFLSASETHNQRNVNRSIAESLDGLQAVLSRARAAGAQEIAFGDTTGMANPTQVQELFQAAQAELPGAGLSEADAVQLTAHFHNTRGQGLANVLAALTVGVASFESSFGELGGCPVPPGATGNIATEDLVSMLHEMGISTGIALDELLACAQRVQAILGRPLGSHTLAAGLIDWR